MIEVLVESALDSPGLFYCAVDRTIALTVFVIQ